mmetsp:Transcript_30254/g.90666  ORF Transcript_30254/g.90666 Transcript_30254/m.90666 type:complete len:88 (-) Transcript_30254:162-425(-)
MTQTSRLRDVGPSDGTPGCHGILLETLESYSHHIKKNLRVAAGVAAGPHVGGVAVGLRRRGGVTAASRRRRRGLALAAAVPLVALKR